MIQNDFGAKFERLTRLHIITGTLVKSRLFQHVTSTKLRGMISYDLRYMVVALQSLRMSIAQLDATIKINK